MPILGMAGRGGGGGRDRGLIARKPCSRQYGTEGGFFSTEEEKTARLTLSRLFFAPSRVSSSFRFPSLFHKAAAAAAAARRACCHTFEASHYAKVCRQREVAKKGEEERRMRRRRSKAAVASFSLDSNHTSSFHSSYSPSVSPPIFDNACALQAFLQVKFV